MTKPRILIVGAQHGDERLGPRLQRFLKQAGQAYANVDYLCGNPRALRRNMRFTETDLNRSYNPKIPKTYEEKRAAKILQKIRSSSYDYVLDVHTSTADVDRFYLATTLNSATKRIIGASRINRVVIMPPHIADCSLIGQVPQAVSVEYNRRLARSKQALAELVELLYNLSAQKTTQTEREIFYVKDPIPRGLKMVPSNRNFALSEHGFYPVLFGEKTYTKYQGFAAYNTRRQKM